MNQKYHYNLHGSERKPLIAAISQTLGKPAVYQGAPSFSYRIGDYTVDRSGVLSCGEDVHPDLTAVLIQDLQEQGFLAEKVAADHAAEDPFAEEASADGIPTAEAVDALAKNAAVETAAGEAQPEEDAADENTPDAALCAEVAPNTDAPDKLTIEIPDTGFTPEMRENLKKIVASKATLLQQALGADALPIVELEGQISFPWFTLHGMDGEADAYSRLITAICNMAKRQKRVTATEKPVDNAKFTMRLFLIRLGFIGDEYKTARRILLSNLSGNGSWKSGHPPIRETVSPAIPPNPEEAIMPTAEELNDLLPAETETAKNEPKANGRGEADGR